MLSDLASSTKYLDVKREQKIEKNGMLLTEDECHKPAKQQTTRKGKRKEEYLYSAILADTTLTKRSDMNHAVLPANYTMKKNKILSLIGCKQYFSSVQLSVLILMLILI